MADSESTLKVNIRTTAVDSSGATVIGITQTNVVEGEPVTAKVTTGGVGPVGPAGPTGGIVPITVSASAPSSPNVNDLWIDLS